MGGGGDEKLAGRGEPEGRGQRAPSPSRDCTAAEEAGAEAREIKARGRRSARGQACRALGGAATGLECGPGSFSCVAVFHQQDPSGGGGQENWTRSTPGTEENLQKQLLSGPSPFPRALHSKKGAGRGDGRTVSPSNSSCLCPSAAKSASAQHSGVTFHLRAANAWAEKMKPPQVPLRPSCFLRPAPGPWRHLRPPPPPGLSFCTRGSCS